MSLCHSSLSSCWFVTVNISTAVMVTVSLWSRVPRESRHKTLFTSISSLSFCLFCLSLTPARRTTAPFCSPYHPPHGVSGSNRH